MPDTWFQRTRSRTGRRLTTSPYYPRPTPSLDTRTVGNGPYRTAMWLDGKPCMVTGLREWPKVGDRLEIDGVLWRVVDARRSYICEREPS